MPGPPRKPSHLKAVSGTAQPCRAAPPSVEFEPLADIPDPVDWLPNAHSVNEWRRLAPILVANKLLAPADLSSFGHMCALHGKMVQLWAAGEAPTGHMVAQYIALASAFGLSPTWRGKVKPIGDQDKANTFSKFKKPAG
jgi:phage terminase small subunit